MQPTSAALQNDGKGEVVSSWLQQCRNEGAVNTVAVDFPMNDQTCYGSNLACEGTHIPPDVIMDGEDCLLDSNRSVSGEAHKQASPEVEDSNIQPR